ncbi:unnamed protein product [Clonostachys rosea f. rosea IK726]|uniref:Uncharacterized protein n=1 Tax=Clonostachys rosea f. rosea IK726 TaxID=1349383 RepID=A0ACA9U8H3_BIOOC|nr:unnamed protein product [Clonostachys rosea f. rosea IK726]
MPGSIRTTGLVYYRANVGKPSQCPMPNVAFVNCQGVVVLILTQKQEKVKRRGGSETTDL